MQGLSAPMSPIALFVIWNDKLMPVGIQFTQEGQVISNIDIK